MPTELPTREEALVGVNVIKLWHAAAKWSDETFGSPGDRGPVGPLKHLAKEAIEAAADPGDLLEYADCYLLVMDAVRRAGFRVGELLSAVHTKLAINSRRDYPTPEPGCDEAVEHDRSGETGGGGTDPPHTHQIPVDEGLHLMGLVRSLIATLGNEGDTTGIVPELAEWIDRWDERGELTVP